MQEIKARADVHQALPPQSQHPIGMHYLDDIINRQAADISRLKQSVTDSEAQYHKETARLQGQVVLKDAQHAQEMATLQAELTQLKISHTTQVHNDAVHSKLQNYLNNFTLY